MYDDPQELHHVPGSGEGNAPDTPADPMTAVLAVAEPRHEPPPGTEGPSVLTDPPGAAAGEKNTGGAEDGYGDFTWPEGYVPDPAVMARFLPLAKKLGLDRDGAQQLATLYASLDAERARGQARFIADNNREWLEEIRSNPEFGGIRLERTGEAVAGLIRRYGSPLLTAQIRQMNIGNWPEMFYFLARVSQAMAEDCSPSGVASAGGDRSAAQVLFPDLR